MDTPASTNDLLEDRGELLRVLATGRSGGDPMRRA